MPKEGLGWTFDTVAEQYDQYRPAYPDELYRDLLAYQPITLESRVLEIGIGTGQATPPILAAGCHVTAVEPGGRLAALTRQKFANARLDVVHAAFEEHDCPDGAFDLVYSASAFHWIEEQMGYRKVFGCLKPGGVFARFASHPYYWIEGQEALWEDIQRCYQQHMPKPLNKRPKSSQRYDETAAAERSAIAERYGFVDIQTRTYYREFRYTSREYAQRLSIESDKIAMENAARERLLADIAQTVDAHGGHITVRDMIDLNLARKPE